MEKLRNRVNVTLCNDEIKAKKMIALPTFKHAEIINADFVMIHRLHTKIKQNKQIYTGFPFSKFRRRTCIVFTTISYDCDTLVSCYSILTTCKMIHVFKCYYVLCVCHYFIMYAAC